MVNSKSLINIFWMSTTLICSILVFILIYFLVGEEVKNSKAQIEGIRETYINTQKNIIKAQVKHAVDFIEHQKSTTETKVQEEVKSRTNEAYDTALYIYEKHKTDKSLNQIKK